MLKAKKNIFSPESQILFFFYLKQKKNLNFRFLIKFNLKYVHTEINRTHKHLTLSCRLFFHPIIFQSVFVFMIYHVFEIFDIMINILFLRQLVIISKF